MARFIGCPAINLFPARVLSQTADQTVLRLEGGGDVICPGTFRSLDAGAQVTLGIHPEKLRVVAADTGAVRSEVALCEHFGGETILHLVSGGATLTVKLDGDAEAVLGDTVDVAMTTSGACLFDADGLALALQGAVAQGYSAMIAQPRAGRVGVPSSSRLFAKSMGLGGVPLMPGKCACGAQHEKHCVCLRRGE